MTHGYAKSQKQVRSRSLSSFLRIPSTEFVEILQLVPVAFPDFKVCPFGHTLSVVKEDLCQKTTCG